MYGGERGELYLALRKSLVNATGAAPDGMEEGCGAIDPSKPHITLFRP